MKKTTPVSTKKNRPTVKVDDLRASRDPKGGAVRTSDKKLKEVMDLIKG